MLGRRAVLSRFPVVFLTCRHPKQCKNVVIVVKVAAESFAPGAGKSSRWLKQSGAGIAEWHAKDPFAPSAWMDNRLAAVLFYFN